MKKLKEQRKKAGLTMREVAKRLGISESNVCQHEKGTRKPNIFILKKLAEIYCCSIDDLM